MGSLISRLVEKAKHEDTSRHGRRRHRSRSEKRERSRIQDSALDMLILAAAELIKIEIDNARIRRAQAGRQRPSRPGAMREGNLHDGMRVDAGFVPGNHEAARQPPHRVPGNGIPGPGNLDIPPYGNDADAYSDLSLRGGRKPGSHIRRNPDKKRERRGDSRQPERWSPLGHDRPGGFRSPLPPPQNFPGPPDQPPGMGMEAGENHQWQENQEQANIQPRNPYEKPPA